MSRRCQASAAGTRLGSPAALPISEFECIVGASRPSPAVGPSGTMYQLLFLIHGMGNGAQPTGAPAWFTDIVTGLRVVAKPFAHDKDLVLSSPKAGQVLVVPLTYHPLFDKMRAKWSEQSPSESGWLPLLKGLAFPDPQVLAKLPGWVATSGPFFWTHWLGGPPYRSVREPT